jgi:PPK2 family polyphosphate:nucleotide phosphotransferase
MSKVQAPKKAIRLSKISTKAPEGLDKKKIEKETAAMAKKIGELQHNLYAEGKRSLLIVLQGMDGSGKDGTIKNVFTDCNPTGLKIASFKKPSDEEMAHDFLWRVHKHAPERGQIMVFNRSHYEDILIQRVHKWVSEDRIKKRMVAINAFEQLLIDDGDTTILKFYMHISPERQQEKLQERIDDPTKHWKHNEGDWKENQHWDEYMKCYEYAINNAVVPWHIAPVDSRWYRNYWIAKVVLETLKKMKPQSPIIQGLRAPRK